MLAQRNFLNCLEINAKQEFRELGARLLLPHLRQGARLGAQGESDKHASYAVQTIRALSRATRYCERPMDSVISIFWTDAFDLWQNAIEGVGTSSFRRPKLSGAARNSPRKPVRKN
jgi:hypothetical protein